MQHRIYGSRGTPPSGGFRTYQDQVGSSRCIVHRHPPLVRVPSVPLSFNLATVLPGGVYALTTLLSNQVAQPSLSFRAWFQGI